MNRPMEYSLPEGYARQLFALQILREVYPDWKKHWDPTQKSSDFDIVGYNGPMATRDKEEGRVLVEVRYRENLSLETMNTRGVEINKHKVEVGVRAYQALDWKGQPRSGVGKAGNCLFLVILDSEGVFVTDYPTSLEGLMFEPSKRSASLENSGTNTLLTYLKGFELLYSWDEYLGVVKQYHQELILKECIPFLKELYGKESERKG